MNYFKNFLIANVLLLCFSCLTFSHANAAKILLIQSYHAEFVWDAAYKKALYIDLAGHEIVTFEMDTKRLKPEVFQKKADEAWAKYMEVKPDYVILGDDNALKFLGPKFAATKTPVVFLGVNNNPRLYFEDKILPANITGVLERPLLNRSVAQIRRILPDAKKILILFDNGITAQSSVTKEMKQGNAGGISVESKLIAKEQEWKDTVKNAKANGFDAIIIGLYQTIKTDSGKAVPAPQIMKWTNENSELPLFAFWSYAVGKGQAMGGLVLDGYKMGEAASSIMKEVMAGKVGEPKINKDGAAIFSKSELARWELSLPDLIKKQATLLD